MSHNMELQNLDIVAENVRDDFWCVGVQRKGLIEWVDADFKLNRYQGARVLFKWPTAMQIITKLDEKIRIIKQEKKR